jgi:hypothetical protein
MVVGVKDTEKAHKPKFLKVGISHLQHTIFQLSYELNISRRETFKLISDLSTGKILVKFTSFIFLKVPGEQ